MRVLFMGTPDFAVPSLEALWQAGYDMVGVFTQPDQPKNRGMKQTPPPVKVFAQDKGIPVWQPEKLRDGQALAVIQALKPQLIVVAAYGRILPREILDYPELGCINVHSSLLPRYRGAAPIHWAILNGDSVSGVTIMHMAEALDAGDIISQAEVPIDPDETAEALHDRLAVTGAELLRKTVEGIAAGRALRRPQEASQVTYAPMLSRELSPLDWAKPARALHNQVRGLTPWPGATAELGGARCKIWKTAVLPEGTDQVPGTVLEAGKAGISVACGAGTILRITELQGEGKRRMAAADYLRGNPIP